jgi:RND family efflux transporter MFP subunit
MRTSLTPPKHFITAILTLTTLSLVACNRTEQQPQQAPIVRPVKLLSVGGLTGDATRKYPGAVLATDRVDLSFQVPGNLINLAVREGQRVNKGDLIAQLEPKDFAANLLNAEGTLAKAKAAVGFAIEEYQRYLNIQAKDRGAVSESTVSLKRKGVEVAKADLQSAQAMVHTAKNQLGYTQLRAPFAGVVAQRFVENFQEVQARARIISLQNMKDLDIAVDVPEIMMTPIRNTKPRFFAEFAAAPDRQFDLKIKEIAMQADPQTQTFRLVLTMPAPTGIRVLAGMTTNVGVDIRDVFDKSSSIFIPVAALWADAAGKKMVWLVDTKTMVVHQQAVDTGGLSGADSIHVESGLKADDTIAISGVSSLHEGQVVRAMEGYSE